MILTCPECATRFFVRDGDVPPQGRKVRCSTCQVVWQAMPVAEDGAPLPAPPPPIDPSVFAPSLNSEIEPPLPRQIRARNEEKRQTRQAVAQGVVWALLCAGFAAVLVGAVLFKVQIVRLYPAVAGAYAAVKLPVNPTGLSLENVQGGPGLVNGRASLVITGVERNIEVDARPPSPVRVSLFDKAGKKVAERVSPVDGAPLSPGETRPFSVAMINPPLNVAEFQVEFQFTPGASKPKGADARLHPPAKSPLSHGPELREEAAPTAEVSPAAVAAQPLPAGSPYALPAAASTAPPAAHAAEK